MDGLQASALVLWLLTFPYLILVVLFYKNRHIYPIKGRLPRVSIIESLNVWGFGTDCCLYLLVQYNCVVYNWILFVTSCITQACFNYRLVQLLFNYELTQNISELKNNSNLKDWKANWFTAHRWLAQDNFTVRLTISLAFIYILIIILFEVLAHRICGRSSGWDYSWGLMFSVKGAIGAGFSAIVALKMWKYPNDAFGLKNEFKLRAGTPMLVMAFYQIMSFSNPTLFGSLVNVVLIIACHPLLFFALVPPYFGSRAELSKRSQLFPDELHSLENCLKRADGIQYFLCYLKTEFSSENLLFYLDVRDYKKRKADLETMDIMAIKNHAEMISRKFLDSNSPGAVNLSYENSQSTIAQVQKILKATSEEIENFPDEEIFNIFDQAQLEIYKLMASDSYIRFQKTEAFSNLKSVSSRPTLLAAESKTELDHELVWSPNAMLKAISSREEDIDRSSCPLTQSEMTSMGDGSPISMVAATEGPKISSIDLA